MYELTFYFSAQGEARTKALSDFRTRLAMMKGKSLSSVYRELGCMETPGATGSKDTLLDVGILHTTRNLPDHQDGVYSFFAIHTKSEKAPNEYLWVSYVKEHMEGVQIDRLGNADGESVCKVLWKPNNAPKDLAD